LQRASQQALDDQGPERYEGLWAVGAFAWNQASRDQAGRPETIELGLAAETAAMAVQADGVEAIRTKSMLLKLKAGLPIDPKERQAVVAEMQRLEAKAEELQKARGAENHDHP
jgi:hypothetical protein